MSRTATEQVQATGSTAQPADGEHGAVALIPCHLQPNSVSRWLTYHRSLPDSQAWRELGKRALGKRTLGKRALGMPLPGGGRGSTVIAPRAASGRGHRGVLRLRDPGPNPLIAGQKIPVTK